MATPRQIKAAKLISENIGKTKPDTLGTVLQEAGYSKSVSETPTRVTETKAWDDLLEQYLPDDKLMEVHEGLLNSTRIEHMVFPTGPRQTDDDIPLEGDIPDGLEELIKDGETTKLSDDQIREMIAEVGCKVRRIVHGETARHVYFWSPDATARKNAVELAYKIKGRITSKVKFDGEIRTNPFGGLSVEELRRIAEGKDGND